MVRLTGFTGVGRRVQAWVTRLFAVALACLAASLQGHMDPVGDVQPNVFVEDGRFVVYWYDNEPTRREEPIRCYRQAYGIDGQALGPREELFREYEDWQRGNAFDRLWMFPEFAFEQRVGGQTFLFRNRPKSTDEGNRRRDEGPPGLQMVEVFGFERIREKIGSDELWRRKLLPGRFLAKDIGGVRGYIFDVRDAIVTEDRVILLVYRKPTEEELGEPRTGTRHRETVWQTIYVYPRDRLDRPDVYPIGLCNNLFPSFSYNYVVVRGTKLFFIWLEPIPMCVYWVGREQHALWVKMGDFPAERPTGRLLLSSLDTTTGKVESWVLAEGVHWNMAVALAAIGDRLLVAYHYGSESFRQADPDPETPRSQIKLIFQDLPPAQ